MKKALYTIGALTAVVTPVVAAVSCGTTKQTIKKANEITFYDLNGKEFLDHPNTVTGARNLPEVGKYLNKYLTLRPFSEMKLNKYGIQAMTRFGHDELNEYNLDDGWIDEFKVLNAKYKWVQSDNYNDEYEGSTGFKRFNGDFEIFENVYPEIKSDLDYSNGANLKIDFVIKDKKPSDSLAYWESLKTADDQNSIPITADQLKSMKNYYVEPAADPVKAKETIKNISNAYSLIQDKNQLDMLKQYFNEGMWRAFSDLFTKEQVQKWISDNIDAIYDKWVKYPATDAKTLDGSSLIGDQTMSFNFYDAMKHPDYASIFAFIIKDDRGEKLNIMNGIVFLKYLIDEAVAKGEIKL